MFITYLFLLVIQFFGVHGMEEAIPTIQLRLCYPGRTQKEQIWTQADFDKISLFKLMSSDIKSDYSFHLINENAHITHDYLKDLIKGKCAARNLKQYVKDYNFFIGNDISLDTDGKHGPWKKSLKWQVFCEHKKFFYNTLDKDNHVRDFLYCDISKESVFEKENIILTESTDVGLKNFTDNALKLSICYPYIMHYQHIFKKNDKIMSLEFDNCIIENLELKTLFDYFPNLHTLIIKNSYLKEITDEDHQTLLTRLKEKNQKNLDKEALRRLGRNQNELVDVNDFFIIYKTLNEKDPTKKNFALRHNWYSFVLDFQETKVIDADPLIVDHDPISENNKPILIKGLSNKKLLNQRLKEHAKSIAFFVLASILNILFIKKLVSFYKFSDSGFLPVLPLIWITLSCILKPVLALALYEEITSKSIIIR